MPFLVDVPIAINNRSYQCPRQHDGVVQSFSHSVVQLACRRLLAYWTFSFRLYCQSLRLWHSCALPRLALPVVPDFRFSCRFRNPADSRILILWRWFAPLCKSSKLPSGKAFFFVSLCRPWHSCTSRQISCHSCGRSAGQSSNSMLRLSVVDRIAGLFFLRWDSFPICQSHRSLHRCLPVLSSSLLALLAVSVVDARHCRPP
jgi:hypothetical protein